MIPGRHLALGAAAVAVAVLGTARLAAGFDPKRPNFEVFPDMARSVPYDAFAPNPAFDDGRTLRTPPAGSIARGYMPLQYGTGAEEAGRAGRELENPFKDEPPVLERGRRVFVTFCLPCHGATGDGDGPVARRGVPPPPSLKSEKLRAMKDGQLFHIVTFGQGNMASYASQLEREDRWKVIRFIRTLEEKKP